MTTKTTPEQIMEQAQVFASAWSLVGSRFDSGGELDNANEQKDCLKQMVEALTASQNICGSGAGCLHKDALIEALTAERDAALALAAERLVDAPPQRQPMTPDMFWNNDDPEEMHESIDEFLNDEICNGTLEVGDVRTMQQALKLPNVQIRVTSIDDESCEAEYEVIEPDAAEVKP